MHTGLKILFVGFSLELCVDLGRKALLNTPEPATTSTTEVARELKQPTPKSNHEDERLRRPQPPTSADDKRVSYEEILAPFEADESVVQLQYESVMPPTKCHSVEIVPEDLNGPFANARGSHELTVVEFIRNFGFGFMRGPVPAPNKHGVRLGSPDIDRVELVSLLLHEEPCVYVLNQMPTPPRARVARRRPLDEFEQRGLDAVREGAELVWTREAPTRMFGAIRANATCLDCHPSTQENDLLGAFTYYLDAPVNELKSPWR
jgi:hypothetical protein